MLMRFIKLIFMGVTSAFIVACDGSSPDDAPKDDAAKKVESLEPVDIQGTESINEKLIGSMNEISAKQLDQAEDVNKNTLQQLSETDRQSLIDLTIDESAEAISEDAEKMVDLLEDINGISD